ncbi:MAG: transglycosylase domain-containing protein, partial [Rickettsiales bacterium]|nr:transglycosylase domain-containing protein [Rickettsiales bacterium]
MNKLCFGIFIIFLAVITLILSTLFLISDPSEEFSNYLKIEKPQVLDRNNVALNITYENDWNLHDLIKLEDVPYFLQQAFVQAEDKRFFKHNGIDWLARLNALWGNLVGKKIRGASTITQQVVQMLHPRQRNIWSKWLEGWEAVMLEQKFTKSQILEFYINQVPYSKRNRGIVAGARYYFNSDVALLNKKSMLALALIVRSPNRFDLHKTNSLQDKSFLALAQKLHKNKVISKKDIASILKQPLRIDKAKKNYEIYHFVKYIIDNFSAENKVTIQTTLDLELQKEADLIAHRHLKKLATHKVNNIGLIVVENISNEVLAWVVANSDNSDTKFYDSIISKRQAGSTLKPFLYSMALESGYNAATIIDDSRIDQAVGSGVHQFSNYSHHYYGPVTLRQALANSLNVPAIKTIDDLGVENFLSLLHMLGFESLDKPAQIYGTGLALGNGEIMLLELVRAFSVLSNKGILKDLKFVKDQYSAKGTRIFKSS